MVKGMKRRQVEQALGRHGCVQSRNSGRGNHEKWIRPCGEHRAIIPRHGELSPGVIADTIKRMKCLPEGWLQ
ncbi:type II toxin-antitoxin system HicA family toxin [Nocardiopsis sp. NPDC006139]|uniref:type II toxin-antitoxin system HicA family toxin n=1 Tax=unclassified Nocardiopsis TaxID=2649073 RepID=UPI0033A0B4EB